MTVPVKVAISENVTDAENANRFADIYEKGKEILYLLGIEYDAKTNGAVMKFLTPGGTIFRFFDQTGHRPYFYSRADADLFDKAFEENTSVVSVTPEALHDGLTDETADFARIVVTDPMAVPKLRDGVPDALETKIRYHNCYMFDNLLIPGMPYTFGKNRQEIHERGLLIRKKGGSIVPVPADIPDSEERTALFGLIGKGRTQNVLVDCFTAPIPDVPRTAMDIETETLNAEKADGRVLSVAFYSLTGRSEVHVLYRPEVEVRKPANFSAKVFVYQTEYDLIAAVFVKLNKIPLLVTFNGDEFDLPYLMNRWKALGGKMFVCPIYKTREAGCRIKDGLHVDLYSFLKTPSVQNYIFKGKYASFSLDVIAKALLGEGKIPHEEGKEASMPFEDLIAYNLKDAELTLKLTTFNNALLMNIMIVLMRLGRIVLEDLDREGISAWVRNMYHALHRERGWIIPNMSDIAKARGNEPVVKSEGGKRFRGAEILEPVPGIHWTVKALDFASLYPGNIDTGNLGYSTVRCPHPECKKNIPVAELGHWVCTKNRAPEAEILGYLKKIRTGYFKSRSKTEKDPVKKAIATAFSEGIKVFMNASFGVFGSEEFPLHCLPMAEIVTAMGRDAIRSVIDFSETNGQRVIYGDTDSVFLENPPAEFVERAKKEISESLKIDLEVDKEYRFVCFSSRKKNYLGVTESGGVEVKGMTGKKSDTPPFIRAAFSRSTELLSKVGTPADLETAKAGLSKEVRKVLSALRNGNVPPSGLQYEITLTRDIGSYSNNPQHVRVAREIAARTGKTPSVDDKIRFVKTVDGPVAVDIADPARADIKKYEEAIRTAFEQLIDPLDMTFEEANNSSLAAFMKAANRSAKK